MLKALDPKEHNRLLRLRVAQLEAQLAAQGLEPEPEVPAALHALTPQELALYRLLDHAKGRFLSRAELDRALRARWWRLCGQPSDLALSKSHRCAPVVETTPGCGTRS